MKVLFTADTFLPAVRGGAELYLYYLARAMRDGGHEVHILHTESADNVRLKRGEIDKLPCTIIEKPHTTCGHGDYFAGSTDVVDRAFVQLCDEFGPDIVHINQLKKLSPKIPRLSRERGAGVVFTLHDYWIKCDRGDLRTNGALCDGPAPARCAECNRSRYARWVNWEGAGASGIATVKRMAKNVLYGFERPGLVRAFEQRESWVRDVVENTSLMICPSRFLLETMARFGVPVEKLHYSDYGMPGDVFAANPVRSSRSRLRFGFIGGVSQLKGIDVLLDAFEGFDEADLWIFGKVYGDVAERIRSLSKQSHIQYKGILFDDQKADVLANLDGLIVPSVWYENSPLVIHEAYLAGTPVITSNIGGMKELVPDGVCGIQFDVGDAVDLRRKLQELCRNPSRIEQLRGRIPHVKSMDEHLVEILDLYRCAQANSDGVAMGGAKCLAL